MPIYEPASSSSEYSDAELDGALKSFTVSIVARSDRSRPLSFPFSSLFVVSGIEDKTLF